MGDCEVCAHPRIVTLGMSRYHRDRASLLPVKWPMCRTRVCNNETIKTRPPIEVEHTVSYTRDPLTETVSKFGIGKKEE
jgi:hypothetical protein